MDLMFLYAILAGIFTAVESSINSQLGKQLTPSVATMYSLVSGFVLMFLFRLLQGASSKLYLKIFTVEPIYLFGGFFGAAIIYLSAKAIPSLGMSKALTLILAAQMVTGMVIDYAVSGMSVDLWKMLGVALLLLGSNLILR